MESLVSIQEAQATVTLKNSNVIDRNEKEARWKVLHMRARLKQPISRYWEIRRNSPGSWQNVSESKFLFGADAPPTRMSPTLFPGAPFAVQAEVLKALALEDYGPSGEDVTHRFVLAGTLHVPSGFEVTTLTQAESARPFTITTADDSQRISVNRVPTVSTSSAERLTSKWTYA